MLTFVDFDGCLSAGYVCEACLGTLDRLGLRESLQRSKDDPEEELESDADRLCNAIEWYPICPRCLEDHAELSEKQLVHPFATL